MERSAGGNIFCEPYASPAEKCDRGTGRDDLAYMRMHGHCRQGVLHERPAIRPASYFSLRKLLRLLRKANVWKAGECGGVYSGRSLVSAVVLTLKSSASERRRSSGQARRGKWTGGHIVVVDGHNDMVTARVRLPPKHRLRIDASLRVRFRLNMLFLTDGGLFHGP